MFKLEISSVAVPVTFPPRTTFNKLPDKVVVPESVCVTFAPEVTRSTVTVEVASRSTSLANVVFVSLRKVRSAPVTVTAPEPKAFAFCATKEPALTFTAPESELLFPDKITIPPVVLLIPKEPPKVALTVPARKSKAEAEDKVPPEMVPALRITPPRLLVPTFKVPAPDFVKVRAAPTTVPALSVEEEPTSTV